MPSSAYNEQIDQNLLHYFIISTSSYHKLSTSQVPLNIPTPSIMNQSNPSDERPNRKARKADNKYKATKRKAAAIFKVAETKRGKKYNEKLAKKKDEKIDTFQKCLNDIRLANPTNHALPQGEDQEMVQIKIEDKVFDVLVLNFKDGKLLQGIQEYERFEMSKRCWTIYWRKHLNRNSECKALKGKFIFSFYNFNFDKYSFQFVFLLNR